MSTATPSVLPGKVVSIHYTLTDDEGVVLDKSQAGKPLAYLHGYENIIPGLESGLAGRKLGDKLKVDVTPEDGYGVHDPEGVQKVPRAAFPRDIDLRPGMQFSAENDGGGSGTIWILSVADEHVMIDLNHPLAGKTLHFDVTIAEIRDASREEVSHGHPHGPEGHHHH